MVRRPKNQRGVTLIEVMVAVALAVLLSGGMFFGIGMLSGARLRQSSTMIVGAVRIAYNHANSTSRPTRLVFDLQERTLSIEDSDGTMLVQSGDRTGGAAAADELEAEAVADGEAIVEGPRAPRPEFRPVQKLLGFDPEKSGGKKELDNSIYFRQVEVEHQDMAAEAEGRVYLYFWPGGQTERAAIQLQAGNLDTDDPSVITILVSPLTGRVEVLDGAVDMPRPRDDGDASERVDTG
jgi:general secretion pathway protein H